MTHIDLYRAKIDAVQRLFREQFGRDVTAAEIRTGAVDLMLAVDDDPGEIGASDVSAFIVASPVSELARRAWNYQPTA